jgi:hypothetical protein
MLESILDFNTRRNRLNEMRRPTKLKGEAAADAWSPETRLIEKIATKGTKPLQNILILSTDSSFSVFFTKGEYHEIMLRDPEGLPSVTIEHYEVIIYNLGTDIRNIYSDTTLPFIDFGGHTNHNAIIEASCFPCYVVGGDDRDRITRIKNFRFFQGYICLIGQPILSSTFYLGKFLRKLVEVCLLKTEARDEFVKLHIVKKFNIQVFSLKSSEILI